MSTRAALAWLQLELTIQPIVEGHGDVAAVPVLLRRFVAEAQVWPVRIGRPIRQPRGQLVGEAGVKRVVRLACVQPNCGAVLMLFDGDSDCPAELGPIVHRWATAAAGGVPCGVVLAHREFEAWFLAAIESLRGRRGIRLDAETPPDPENPRGANEQLELRMHRGASYMETADQPAFSEQFSLSVAYRRSRSFRKLANSFGNLVQSMGHDIDAWPPATWTAGV
ncbi:MAG: DUF4276 family protein [Bryobacterales bacterium]|nr:DUF4276 family protein [Bryobacterales bacterium]